MAGRRLDQRYKIALFGDQIDSKTESRGEMYRVPFQTTPDRSTDVHFFDDAGSRGKWRGRAADDETDAGRQKRPARI